MERLELAFKETARKLTDKENKLFEKFNNKTKKELVQLAIDNERESTDFYAFTYFNAVTTYKVDYLKSLGFNIEYKCDILPIDRLRELLDKSEKGNLIATLVP